MSIWLPPTEVIRQENVARLKAFMADYRELVKKHNLTFADPHCLRDTFPGDERNLSIMARSDNWEKKGGQWRYCGETLC